jgi:YesN/AraC family two-component response regulator
MRRDIRVMLMGSRQDWNEKKILVIEPEAEIRNILLKSLGAKGFYIIAAENGLIGIQRAQQELPDLIVSEILISKLDGYSVLSTLRQNFVTAIIPLIFVTSKVNRGDIRKAMELGADDYLTKPCTGDELLRAIAACLHKRNILQYWYAKQSQALPEPPLSEHHQQCQVCAELPLDKSHQQCQTCAELIPTDNRKPTKHEFIFPSDPLLSEVFNFIEANYHRQITLCDVAVAVGYSSTYLTNLVRRQTGQTVQNWIIERRMAAIRTLLLETDETVEEIATKVGYHSVAHFFRQFRQHHHTSPQAWRREQLIRGEATAKELLLISKDR